MKRKDPLRHLGFKKLNQEVISFIGYRTRGKKSESPYYKCRCDYCGNEYGSFIENLKDVRKSGLSCRKCSNVQNKKYNKMSASNAQISIVFSNYKARAKMKNIEFSLTKEEFTKLVKNNCHYCNQEPNKIRLDRVKNRRGEHDSSCLLNGIDKVNNDMGYTINNCVSCCEDCNKAKRNLSYSVFLQLIKNIYENLNLQNR